MFEAWNLVQFFDQWFGVAILQDRSDWQIVSVSCTTIFKSVPTPGFSLRPVDPRMSDVAAKIFEESLNKVVLVQLKGGRSVRGRLYSFDQHMNLVLEEAEDVTNADATKKLGTIIVRGDNVVLVSPPPKR
jgi:small nuclear ribonucleoprotein